MKIQYIIFGLLIIGSIVIFLVFNAPADKEDSILPNEDFNITSAFKQKTENKQNSESLSAAKLISDKMALSPAEILNKPFTVQIASFRDKDRAETIVEKLKKLDYDSRVETRDLGGKGVWYRVQIGRFETKDEAANMLELMKEEGYNDSFIILR